MKAIILSRVSTAAQNLDKQTEELSIYAKHHGYKDPIVIEYKESAIKLSEDERAGIIEMKHYIENDNISAVFIWELSRLSRRATDLYLLRDYFQAHHVQLYCLKPEFKLFDDDWNIESTAGITFAIFNTLSEQEMKVKKERLLRGKKRNTELGKFNGAKVRFGYAVDKEGFIVVDEEKAKIVRQIFEMYADGKSTNGISKYFSSMGFKFTGYYISKLLHTEALTGRINSVSGYHLPRIISDDLFDKVQNALKVNLNRTKTTKAFHLCSGLIVCLYCNHAYTFNHNQYRCCYHFQKEIGREICPNTCTIDAKSIDDMVWHLTTTYYKWDLITQNKDTQKNLEKELKEVNKKISVIENEIDKIQGKIDRINELYISGSITAQKYETYKISVDDERSSQRRQKQALIESKDKIYDLLTVLKEKNATPVDVLLNSIENINEMSKEEKYNLVHQYIKKIDVQYTDESKRDKIVTIWMTDGSVKTYMKEYRKDKLTEI